MHYNIHLFLLILVINTPPAFSQKLVINNIDIHGNKVTKDHIILRELSFSKGDTLPENVLEQQIEASEETLINTSLFNFATITYDAADSGRINVLIKVVERWYIWPIPIFDLAETNFNTWWLNKNFSRVNYGIFVVRQNFRGRKETVKLKLQLGYSREIAMQYLIPFLNEKQTTGIGFTGGYSDNHEINYKTDQNKRIFYKNTLDNVRSEYFSRITLTDRRKIYNTNKVELQYSHIEIDDTIADLTSDYLKNNSRDSQYFSLSWQFKRDKRDYQSYPLKGYLFTMELAKYGLGVVNREKLNVLFHYFTFNKYWDLGRRFYYAAGVKTKFSLLDTPPYYIQRGLGYRNYVRGYEYYVIDGQHYGLLKTNLKFQLLKPQKTTLGFIKAEQFNTFHYSFYLNLFADVGYVADDVYFRENPLANQYQFGTGIGVDYVTYYDTVIRMEFSFNKLKENGIFLHFTRPI